MQLHAGYLHQVTTLLLTTGHKVLLRSLLFALCCCACCCNALHRNSRIGDLARQQSIGNITARLCGVVYNALRLGLICLQAARHLRQAALLALKIIGSTARTGAPFKQQAAFRRTPSELSHDRCIRQLDPEAPTLVVTARELTFVAAMRPYAAREAMAVATAVRVHPPPLPGLPALASPERQDGKQTQAALCAFVTLLTTLMSHCSHRLGERRDADHLQGTARWVSMSAADVC